MEYALFCAQNSPRLLRIQRKPAPPGRGRDRSGAASWQGPIGQSWKHSLCLGQGATTPNIYIYRGALRISSHFFTVPFGGRRERESEVSAGARIAGEMRLAFFIQGGILPSRWLVTTVGCALSGQLDPSTMATPTTRASRASRLRVLCEKIKTPNDTIKVPNNTSEMRESNVGPVRLSPNIKVDLLLLLYHTRVPGIVSAYAYSYSYENRSPFVIPLMIREGKRR